MLNRSEILALALQLPANEREELALSLLKSVATGKVDLAAGEGGKTNEVAEAVSPYDAGYRQEPVPRKDFWEALQAFRASADFEDLDMDDLEVEKAFGDLRDPSPGREVAL